MLVTLKIYIFLKATLILPVTQSSMIMNWIWYEVNSVFTNDSRMLRAS